MILEEVQGHPERTDLFLNKIVTSHDDVEETDRSKIKRILLKILNN